MEPSKAERGQAAPNTKDTPRSGGFWTTLLRLFPLRVGTRIADKSIMMTTGSVDTTGNTDNTDNTTDPVAGNTVGAGPDVESGNPKDINKGYTKAEDQNACSKVWNVYDSEAERYDKALVESWKGDMNGMLIFSGLFSASLTAFIIESYKILQPDPADTTVALLIRLVQSTEKSAQLATPPPFQVTTAALACNMLWFVSLALSLTCSLLATLVEQWAREFLHKTDIHPAPVRRARVFSFLYLGIQQFHMHAVVDIIPMLLHVALFLFFGGLVAFLLPVNVVLMYIMGVILVVFLILYTTLTVLPVLRLACPYRTPLSGAMWKIRQLSDRYKNRHSEQERDKRDKQARSMAEAVLDEALEDTPERRERDVHAVKWTVACLTDDEELLRFAEAIPDALYGSKGFHDANSHLFLPLLNTDDPQISVGNRIVDLLRRSDDPSLDDKSRIRRQTACMKAIWALAMLSDPAPSQRPPISWFDGSAIDIFSTMDSLDPYYAISACTAVRYSRWTTFKSCLQTIQEELEGYELAPIESGEKILQSIRQIMDRVSEEDMPPSRENGPGFWHFAGYRDKLRKLKDIQSSPTISTTLASVSYAVKELLKQRKFLSPGISFQYIDAALDRMVYPYGFFATLQKLLPGLSKDSSLFFDGLPNPSELLPEPDLSEYSFFFFDRLPNPSEVTTMTSDIHDIDRVMQSLLRLHPTFKHGIPLPPTVKSYIANRNSESALLHALLYCGTVHIQTALKSGFVVDWSEWPLSRNEAVEAQGLLTSEVIWVLCDLMHRDKAPFIRSDLHNWVNSLLPYLEKIHCASTRAVLMHHVLSDLQKRLTFEMNDMFWGGTDNRDANAALMEIFDHPLLSDHLLPLRTNHKPDSKPSTRSEPAKLFSAAAADHLIESQFIVMCQFLSVYSATATLFKPMETMAILTRESQVQYFEHCFRRKFSPRTQLAFADGVHIVIGRLTTAAMPSRDTEPAQILNMLWDWMSREVWSAADSPDRMFLHFDDVASATILVEALDSYLALDGIKQDLRDKDGPIYEVRLLREHCARITAEAASSLSQLPGHSLSTESLLVMTGAHDPAVRMLLQVGGQGSMAVYDGISTVA